MLFRFVYVPYTCSIIKKKHYCSLFFEFFPGSGDYGVIFFFRVSPESRV